MKYKKNNYIYIAVSFCVLTIATTIFMFSNKNYNKAVHKIIDFDNKNVESIYLRVTDVYDQKNQKKLSEFFSEKNSLKLMKEFSHIVNEEFNFLEFDTQTLLLKDIFRYKDEFRKDYGSSSFGVNDHIGISLQSVQIGKNAYDFFTLENQVASGKGFENNDFIFDNKIIPAILGHEYSELINIGDTTKFNYLSKDISVKIIGFLKKDTSIGINNKIHFLDRCIVIPSLEVDFEPENEEDEKFQKILYSLKNWGYIKMNDGEDYYDYKNKVDEISNKLSLNYVLNEGFVGPYISNISNTMHSSKGVFLITSIFLFLILSVIFTYIYVWNFNRNKKVYAIHLICGCSFLRLKLRIYFEIFIQFILSLGLSSFINRILLGQDSIYLSERTLLEQAISQTVALSTIIMLGICLALNIYFNKSNIYASIQKED
ncbi:hypothetical protein [Brassicibacter mesophilus]|uniref:hypothetical protein n=1 Tax=Brassicibacter mesophilus TaxID=745119 RepID=UPI003D1E6D61